MSASGPLVGYKVLEMAGIGPNPMCDMLLADMGAEIIEVSLPEFELTPETLFTVMMVEASTYHRQMLREKGMCGQ